MYKAIYNIHHLQYISNISAIILSFLYKKIFPHYQLENTVTVG